MQVVRNNLRGLKIVTVVEKDLHGKLWRAPVERGLRRQKIVPQASACCAKSPKFSDFPGVDPAQQQVRLNVTGA